MTTRMLLCFESGLYHEHGRDRFRWTPSESSAQGNQRSEEARRACRRAADAIYGHQRVASDLE